MMSRIRLLSVLVIILAALIILPVGAAQAQNAVRFSQLTIRLWPEFDKPSVLIFLIGQTADGVSVPVDLKFGLPQGASINAIAYYPDKSQNQPSDQVTSKTGEGSVSITTPNGSFHIEFYDPALRVNNQQRTYSFTWKQDFAVDALTWEVEQPAGATNFKVDPPGGTTITDLNGLPEYQLKTAGVPASQSATVSISYDKADNTLTADTLQTQASTTNTSAGASQPSGDTTLIVAVAAAILVLVIAGVVIFYRRGAFEGIGARVIGAEAPAPHERKPRGRAAKKQPRRVDPGQRFCPQCGQAARPGDLFCRNCGTRLHG